MARRKKQKSLAARQKHKAPTTKDAVNQELDRIRRLREKNARLEDDTRAFEQECVTTIREAEQEVLAAQIAQTHHLAGFLTRKTLAQWQRFELIDWIHDNLRDIASNPFHDPETVFELAKTIDQLRGLALPEEPPEDTIDPSDLFGDDFDDELDDEFEQNDLDDEDFDSAGSHQGRHDNPGFDPNDAEDAEAEEAERRRRQSLDALLDTRSIKTLFRQLARQLHPDREPDAEKKLERDELMARAAQARDEHDLFTLLSMYQTHVGGSPFELLAEDEDTVLKILKAQSTELRQTQQDILHATPFRSFINEHFAGKTPAARKRKLAEHCKKARATADDYLATTHSIRSIPTLRPYLEQRYDDAVMIGPLW